MARYAEAPAGSSPVAGHLAPSPAKKPPFAAHGNLTFPANMLYLGAGWSSWQLVGLITRRSQVQILPPQPI